MLLRLENVDILQSKLWYMAVSSELNMFMHYYKTQFYQDDELFI